MSKILLFGGESDIAKSFLKKGSDIIATDIKDCDVRDYYMVEKKIKRYNPDIIINFAGISNPQLINGSRLTKIIDEININLIGSFNIAKVGTENGISMFVFIASVAGMYGKAEHGGYSASKAGVISLVQTLNMEGHKAYSISPGRVNTKMREKDFPGEDIKTRLSTDEVADVIADCINGIYKSGDNIIIRKIGYTTHLKIDKGAWKKYLNVQPYGTPKLI